MKSIRQFVEIELAREATVLSLFDGRSGVFPRQHDQQS